MPKFKKYTYLPKLFKFNPSLINLPAANTDEHNHTISVSGIGIDIIRQLPWLYELAITEGLTYDPSPNPIEKILYENYYVDDGGNFASKLLKQLASDYKVHFIVGEPGSGKTTVINYLLRHSNQFNDYRVSHYIILITCNKELSEDLTLREHVTLLISEALNGLAIKYDCTEEKLYRKIKYRALAKGIKRAMENFRTGEFKDYKGDIKSYVVSTLLTGHNYNSRVLDWFNEYHKEVTIDIVIDNIDCYTKEERVHCFAGILASLVRPNTKIILPLRQGTYAKHEHTDPLFQYEGVAPPLALGTPDFGKILKERLTKIPAQIKNHEVDAWVTNITKIKTGLSTEAVIEIFNGVFGENNRAKLKAAKAILESPLLQDTKSYSSSKNILKALMLGDYLISLPEYSELLNLFNNDESPGYQNTLVLWRILQVVLQYEPLLVQKDTISDVLFSAGYGKGSLKVATNSLLRYNLIKIHGRPELSRLPDSMEGIRLETTSMGEFYLNSLSKNPTYLILTAQSSYFENQFIRMINGDNAAEILSNLIRKEKSPRIFLLDLYQKHRDELFISSESFSDYIDFEEEIEAKACNDSLSDFRLGQKIRTALLGSD